MPYIRVIVSENGQRVIHLPCCQCADCRVILLMMFDIIETVSKEKH